MSYTLEDNVAPLHN